MPAVDSEMHARCYMREIESSETDTELMKVIAESAKSKYIATADFNEILRAAFARIDEVKTV